MFVDFDDLLLICKKLLSENSKLLEKISIQVSLYHGR